MSATDDSGKRDYVLYRWWAKDGRLLYVGKSVSLYKRISQHRRGSEFFAEAATMTLQRLESAEQLSGAEMNAIRTEKPAFNIMGRRATESAATRKLVVGDLDPQSACHWVEIDYEEIRYGDLIRWSFKHSPGEVSGQGIADDYGLGDDNEHEWYLYTSEAEEIILDEFMAGLCDIRRWEHAEGDATMEAYKKAAAIGISGWEED